jgi:hypothetical protein
LRQFTSMRDGKAKGCRWVRDASGSQCVADLVALPAQSIRCGISSGHFVQ